MVDVCGYFPDPNNEINKCIIDGARTNARFSFLEFKWTNDEMVFVFDGVCCVFGGLRDN